MPSIAGWVGAGQIDRAHPTDTQKTLDDVTGEDLTRLQLLVTHDHHLTGMTADSSCHPRHSASPVQQKFPTHDL